MYFWSHRGQIMNASLQRRIDVASCWSSTRIAVLDELERYEDSFAITEEFREWITCLGENQEQLESTVLKVPNFSCETFKQESSETDEMLEI